MTGNARRSVPIDAQSMDYAVLTTTVGNVGLIASTDSILVYHAATVDTAERSYYAANSKKR